MLHILLLTRSYPADDALYQYPFVHRRVLGYLAAGHKVTVFRQGSGQDLRTHEFDGVTCFTGDQRAFARLAAETAPDVIAVHGFCETMWPMLASVAGRVPIRAWLHGSEIPEFFRRKAERIANPQDRAEALDAVDVRRRFWRDFLADVPHGFGLVFVSHSAVELARVDMGAALRDEYIAVIPNPIDTDLFAYRPKSAEDRYSILSIRPFDSWTYGNDMIVGAILHLRDRPGFDRLRFTIIGDGPQFDDVLGGARDIPNVVIRQGFLSQPEIAAEHGRHGQFLVPTRLDTQGVSRDEAMSSGLVPVTNRVSAVPEFVDESCAALADPDDAQGLGDAIWRLAGDPQMFLSKSVAAAKRVRNCVSSAIVIPSELALLESATRAFGVPELE